MDIPLHGRYTERDIRRGLMLIRRGRLLVSGISIFVLLAAVAVLFVVTALGSGAVTAAMYLGALVPMLLLLLLFGGLQWALLWFQARRYARAPLFQGTVEGHATGDGLEFRSEQAESKERWDAYVRHALSADTVLLYQTSGVAVIIPRGLFATDEDWQHFRQHVQAAVPNRRQSAFKRRWVVYAVVALIFLALILLNVFGGR